MKLSSFVPLAIAFSAAGALAFTAAGVAVSALETNSADSVSFELDLQGHEWTDVQSDGLQVVLSGEAPSEAERFKALSIAGTVVDAARIIDDMSVKETQQLVAPRFSIEMLRNDSAVSLIGLIPAETDREAVRAQVVRIADGARVSDFLETADHPTPEGWDAALSFALLALEELPRSKISVDAEKIDIKAAADSERQRDNLQAELARRAPDGLRTALTITAPRPVITPFTLRFLIDDEVASFDVCSADTADALSQILTAAGAAGLQGKSDCRLGLGAPTANWGAAAAAGIAAVADLGGGSVTMTDADITLIALQGTNQGLFDQVSAQLENDLPELFALTAVLPEPEVETEEGPPEFAATFSPEGQVQMRGHVGDALAHTAIETYAQSRFGADRAYLAVEPHSNLPAGWSLRALAGLAALSQLSHGSVSVTADNLTVRGDTGDAEARTRIAQLLSTQLGDGQAYSIDVTYREELDPLANIPTPDICLARIIEITDARKLTFEPGSTTLDADSLRTITAISEILRECPEFAIVVEGHTDSQGREEMNLNLSQARAEAVVTALRNERIAWPDIVPRGYGEVDPIAPNDTEEGREANRRIEFKTETADDGAEAPVQEALEQVSEDAPSE